jgi:Cupin domain
VLVEYGPGGYSPGHTHPKSAFIYATVLEGAIRSQVNDGPVTTYKAGQSFSELPGDRHGVSANASTAKLLAVFVVDTNETELTIPIPGLTVIMISQWRVIRPIRVGAVLGRCRSARPAAEPDRPCLKSQRPYGSTSSACPRCSQSPHASGPGSIGLADRGGSGTKLT